MSNDSDKVHWARGVASSYLDDIKRLFKPTVHVTLIVRRPGEPESDFLLTDDELDQVQDALDRAKTREDS